jgi:hypothetical protein
MQTNHIPQTAQTFTTLYGCKIKDPSNTEEVLFKCQGYTNLDKLKESGEQFAQSNEYHKLRIEVKPINKN